MLIREVEGATRRLGAPADWDQSKSACDVLPIVDVDTDNGPFMVSAWQPTAEELAALNSGASIRLWIQGTNHPVVALAVDESTERCDAPASADERAAEALAIELSGVKDTLEAGGGFWRACSGCHETEDGHPVGKYPYSAILKCDLGAGCSECGGIGAVWDNTDYAAMCDALERVGLLNGPDAPAQAAAAWMRADDPRDCISDAKKRDMIELAGTPGARLAENYSIALGVIATTQAAEPVAWRSWKDGDGYGFWDTKDEAELASAHDFEPEPLYAAPQPPAQEAMPALTNAMRAVITNESGAYQSADALYAALCAAAGVERPAPACAREEPTYEQIKAVAEEHWSSCRYIDGECLYAFDREDLEGFGRALIATHSGRLQPRAAVTSASPRTKYAWRDTGALETGDAHV
ncbi:TPA: hypothetical protein QDB05_000229 [Burkholderia vietnamiensis]|nr:hypothetical protein [Burkholderia vietnamiensis]